MQKNEVGKNTKMNMQVTFTYEYFLLLIHF